jgi:membrane protease YdiL (CAAX protease family)
MDPSATLIDSSIDPPNNPATAGCTDPRPRPSADRRVLAAIEVILCSDFPTQAGLAWAMTFFGFGPLDQDGGLNLQFVAPLLLVDTVLLIGLILLFLRLHGERPRKVFLGEARWGTELRAALPMVGVAYAIALTVMLIAGAIAPWLHTVEKNPLQNLLLAPRDAVIFALVVVLAGGVREELQRAFILTRFEQSLGGPAVGIVVSSLAFGVGHIVQGVDAAIATGILGAFWGVAYLRRRSVISPVVSHAAFDLLQIAFFLISGH